MSKKKGALSALVSLANLIMAGVLMEILRPHIPALVGIFDRMARLLQQMISSRLGVELPVQVYSYALLAATFVFFWKALADYRNRRRNR